MRCTMTDKKLVSSIITDESVWNIITEDNTPDDFKVNVAEHYLSDDRVIVLNPGDGIVFILVPHNSVTMNVHTCIIAESRGKEAFVKTKSAIDWFFTNTNYSKIISWIPVFNRVALIFALKAGFVKEGLVEKSFLKYGKLHDQTLVGFNKEKWQCQRQSL